MTLVAGAMLAFSAAANASLTVNYVFNGHGGYSSDGLGQNGTGGTRDSTRVAPTSGGPHWSTVLTL